MWSNSPAPTGGTSSWPPHAPHRSFAPWGVPLRWPSTRAGCAGGMAIGATRGRRCRASGRQIGSVGPLVLVLGRYCGGRLGQLDHQLVGHVLHELETVVLAQPCNEVSDRGRGVGR